MKSSLAIDCLSKNASKNDSRQIPPLPLRPCYPIGYTPATLNYIWRKHPPAKWLSHHVEDLERRFRRSLVLIDYPDNSRVTLEIACSSIHAAQKLQDEFGGKILRLEPDWLQGFSKENRKKPLRIGSRLIVFNSPNQARPSS